MSQTEFILWAVFGISVLALIGMQVRSILAAIKLGGRSARGVVALRSVLVVLLTGLFAYVAWVQASR